MNRVRVSQLADEFGVDFYTLLRRLWRDFPRAVDVWLTVSPRVATALRAAVTAKG